MKVWIDISNSPHPLLFGPVSRRLEELGHEVAVTARDHAQSVALARQYWPVLDIVGEESPSGRLKKLSTIWTRARGLAAWARGTRPDVALSHNSYAQIVAARMLRLPAVTAMDYEHQPANHLAFRLASRILFPECIPLERVRKQGARPRKVVRYPGLKEEAYIGDFEPDAAILERLGVARDGRTIVMARTPPSKASYHQFENPLFVEALRTVCAQDTVTCVVLPRDADQAAHISSLGLPNCVMPSQAVDSRSLMYFADFVLGAGGTMTREAALLGVPTYTLFAGQPAAVDESLMQRGLLTRLESAAQLQDLRAGDSQRRSIADLRATAEAILDVFVASSTRFAD